MDPPLAPPRRVTALSSNRTVTKKNRSERKDRRSRNTALEYSTDEVMNREA
jgi:hypothetical protein